MVLHNVQRNKLLQFTAITGRHWLKRQHYVLQNYEEQESFIIYCNLNFIFQYFLKLPHAQYFLKLPHAQTAGCFLKLVLLNGVNSNQTNSPAVT